MKYLIASDIHGSAASTRALLERFQAEKADILVLLGDIFYHGPRNDLPDTFTKGSGSPSKRHGRSNSLRARQL